MLGIILRFWKGRNSRIGRELCINLCFEVDYFDSCDMDVGLVVLSILDGFEIV